MKIIDETNKNHVKDFDNEIEKYTNKFLKKFTIILKVLVIIKLLRIYTRFILF